MSNAQINNYFSNIVEFWQIKPLSVRYGLGISDHDSEGRLVTAEFDTFYLICGYIPNSGDGLKRLVLVLNYFSFIILYYIILYIITHFIMKNTSLFN